MKSASVAMLVLALATSGALAGDAEDIQAQAALFEQAANSGDAAGMKAQYTEDAMLLPPDAAAVQGADNIEAFWQQVVDAGVSELKITPKETEVFGDHAVRVISFTFKPGGAQEPVTGKGLEIWQKGSDGQWRLHRDAWNMDAVATAQQ
jgi:uncharacterized protein (TIGR02246 family)